MYLGVNVEGLEAYVGQGRRIPEDRPGTAQGVPSGAAETRLRGQTHCVVARTAPCQTIRRPREGGGPAFE